MRSILKVAKYARHDIRNVKEGRNKILAQNDDSRLPLVKSTQYDEYDEKTKESVYDEE